MNPRDVSFEFDYEIEALGQAVMIGAKARLSPPGHDHPGDPDNDAELAIESAASFGKLLTDLLGVSTWAVRGHDGGGCFLRART